MLQKRIFSLLILNRTGVFSHVQVWLLCHFKRPTWSRVGVLQSSTYFSIMFRGSEYLVWLNLRKWLCRKLQFHWCDLVWFLITDSGVNSWCPQLTFQWMGWGVSQENRTICEEEQYFANLNIFNIKEKLSLSHLYILA